MLCDAIVKAGFVGLGLRFGANLLVVVLRHARIMRMDCDLSMQERTRFVASERRFAIIVTKVFGRRIVRRLRRLLLSRRAVATA